MVLIQTQISYYPEVVLLLELQHIMQHLDYLILILNSSLKLS